LAVWLVKNAEPGTLLEQAMRARGLSRADLSPPLPDPASLPGAAEAARVLLEAARAGRKIAVFGDYDCDGVCGAFVLEEVLRRAGADVFVRLPRRDEGYGLRPRQVAELAARGAEMIVTADNGIAALEAARAARELGLELVVTDHHEPGRELPPCRALADPKADPGPGGFRDYCGAGVAWLVAAALCGLAGLPRPDDLLDLAALATVVDVAPITGPNRALARRGLELMRRRMRPGLKALAEAAGVSRVGGRAMMWQLGPRINAAGRMGDPALALGLLRAESPSGAESLARELDRLNRERQALVEAVAQECLAAYDGSWFPVFVGPWPRGVVGVAAGRLAEALRRPVLVGSEEGGLVRASGRTVGEFDLLAALEEARESCGAPERFGGHRAACGAEFAAAVLPRLREALDRAARKRLRPEDVAEILEVDGVIRSAPSVGEIAELDLLEPFGAGNPEPAFALAGRAESVRRGEGWQLVCVKGLKFFVPPEFPAAEGRPLHAAVVPYVEEWNGRVSAVARALDVRAFSLTRKRLAEAWAAWRAGREVPEPAERVFRELGLPREGGYRQPLLSAKGSALLRSPTFRRYGILLVGEDSSGT
jgi:single-stranded-DNA-specific exonuclease